jgi:hypothetical protein
MKKKKRPQTPLPATSNIYAEIAELPITRSIQRILRRNGIDLPKRARFADVEVLVLHARALSGDVAATKEIVDRIEGKLPER